MIAAVAAATVAFAAAAPAQTRSVVPTWMWVLIGLSVFTNLLILGAFLNNRLRPPPPKRPAPPGAPAVPRHPSQH